MLLKLETETEWLAQRKKDITSTELASLFGLGPKSRLRLWYEKRGEVESDFEDNPLTKWGRRMQNPIVLGICEDQGWQPFDMTGWYSYDKEFGSSFDASASTPDIGVGHLEAKRVEKCRIEDGWSKEAAPIKFEFQMQGQLHRLRHDAPEIKWNCLGVLEAFSNTRLYMREYDAELGAVIDNEVAEFWASVRADTPPKPDYVVDGDLLQLLRGPIKNGDIINLCDNNRAVSLMADYQSYNLRRDELKAVLKPLEKEMAAIENEIHDIMGRNERAVIGDWQVGAKVQTSEDRVQTGSSFRRFDVSKRRKK